MRTTISDYSTCSLLGCYSVEVQDSTFQTQHLVWAAASCSDGWQHRPVVAQPCRMRPDNR